MCTLTIFTQNKTKIITMNRDEAILRCESNQILQNSSIQTTYYHPVDKSSGGTWFGFNNHGFVMALLNRYQESNNNAHESRGLIIPYLLQFKSKDKVLTEINHFSLENFNPFDLIISNSESIHQICWDGMQLSYQDIDLDQPFILTSSSINSDYVFNHRYELFNSFNKANSNVTPELILNNFHLCQNKNDDGSSVYMSRENSHTKSISQITLNKQQLNYQYYNQQHLQNLKKKLHPILFQNISLKLK